MSTLETKSPLRSGRESLRKYQLLARTSMWLVLATASIALGVPAPAVADDQATRALAQNICNAEATLFGATPTDAAEAAALLDGKLTLRPHATVTLPDDPTWSERLVEQNNWEALYQALTWADVLRREYTRTGNAAMLARYAFLLRDWAEDNPSFEEGRSAYSWYDQSSGQRASALACAVSALGTPDWLVQALHTHAGVITRPDQYKGTGN